MDSPTDDELRALRSRAYGPAADIDGDAAAVQRLRELEDQRRLQHPTHANDVAAIPTPNDDAPRAEDPSHAELAAHGDVTTPPDPTPLAPDDGHAHPRPSSVRQNGRQRLLWVASVLAAAALAATVTFLLTWMTPVAASAGAPQIATLQQALGVEVPAGMFGVGTESLVFEFYGLTIIETTESFSSASAKSSECILVLRSDQVPAVEELDPSGGWSFDGPLYSECQVGAFPVTVEVPIDSDTPKEITERYPAGVALQFVLAGDRVGVFLDSE